jgi:phospholipase A1
MKPLAGLCAGLALATGTAAAQAQPANTVSNIASTTNVAPASATASGPVPSAPWLSCARLINDKDARLACYDELAEQQTAAVAPPAPALATSTAALPEVPPQPVAVALAIAADKGCEDKRYSEFSRFWELEAGSDCGTFGIRGYRPISLSVIGSDSVNELPSSPAAGHTATTAIDYKRTETRIQLSVRTKVAQGLLTQGEPSLRDSLWFGYTQQSYWQLFSADLSRPFRSTDHEPELVYVYPTTLALPGDWKLRYSGMGLVHQSNGQSLPLSRSWNRVYLMAGLEKAGQWNVQGRIWQRINESNGSDDNPGISDYIGRGELSALWHASKDSTFGVTLRHSMRQDARGSVRLEWLQALGGSDSHKSDLRFHTQLFSGYGDSLIDYNRRRTVLSVGLSLVDF